jgi:hypothetical protein
MGNVYCAKNVLYSVLITHTILEWQGPTPHPARLNCERAWTGRRSNASTPRGREMEEAAQHYIVYSCVQLCTACCVQLCEIVLACFFDPCSKAPTPSLWPQWP